MTWLLLDLKTTVPFAVARCQISVCCYIAIIFCLLFDVYFLSHENKFLFCSWKLCTRDTSSEHQRWQRIGIGPGSYWFFSDPDPVSLEGADPDQRWSPRGDILKSLASKAPSSRKSQISLEDLFFENTWNFAKNLRFTVQTLFFGEHLRVVSLVLGLGLEHSRPWPLKGLSSESRSLASDFFCVLGRGLEPYVLNSTFNPDLILLITFKLSVDVCQNIR